MTRFQAARAKASPPIKILLVEGQAMMRAGLCLLIDSWRGTVVVGETANPADALAVAKREKPDVVLLDLDLGTDIAGIDLIPRLLSADSSVGIIGLTAIRDTERYVRAMQLGARGLLLKDEPAQNLQTAIFKLVRGNVALSEKLTTCIVKKMVQRPEEEDKNTEKSKFDSLTSREVEVVKLVSEGLKNREIAERLFISEATVRHHLTSIFGKLEVSGRFELIIFLYRHQIVVPRA